MATDLNDLIVNSVTIGHTIYKKEPFSILVPLSVDHKYASNTADEVHIQEQVNRYYESTS